MDEPERFHVEVEQHDAGATITVHGEIDIATIRAITRARDKALANRPGTVVIDLRGVGFIDSSGLKFLLETARLCRGAEWKLQLLRPAADTMKLFQLTGADKHLPFVDPVG
jgi:anti-sigma B factor antagonist